MFDLFKVMLILGSCQHDIFQIIIKYNDIKFNYCIQISLPKNETCKLLCISYTLRNYLDSYINSDGRSECFKYFEDHRTILKYTVSTSLYTDVYVTTEDV